MLRQLLFPLALLLMITACDATKKASTASVSATTEQTTKTYLKFDTPFYDFGTIRLGDRPSYVFTFTNESGEDLEIELVSGCHCTSIEWQENHVFKPGEKGEIKITYDTLLEDGLGEHNKTLDILLKAEDPKTGYQIIQEAKYKVLIEE